MCFFRRWCLSFVVEPGLFYEPLFDREHEEPPEEFEDPEPDDEWLQSEHESSISLLFSWLSPLASGYAICDYEPDGY